MLSHNVLKKFSGWYSGTIDGETGLFPVSYTKPYVKKVYKAPTKMSSAIQKLQKQVSSRKIREVRKTFSRNRETWKLVESRGKRRGRESYSIFMEPHPNPRLVWFCEQRGTRYAGRACRVTEGYRKYQL